MIDTITLRLSEAQFNIVDPNRFNTDLNQILNPKINLGSHGFRDSIARKVKVNEPTLKIRRRRQTTSTKLFLYIEFSIPKYLLGNNLEEVEDKDFELLLTKLIKHLISRGIETTQEALRNARVIKIHYSKNILLPRYVFPHIVISNVSKGDFNSRYEKVLSEHSNSGESLRYRSNSFEIILYDKKRDLKKEILQYTDKRLLAFLHSKYEVFRIEVRLNTQKRIESEFKINAEECNLSKLFNLKYSKDTVTKYWKRISKDIALESSESSEIERFVGSFIAYNPSLKFSTALSAYSYLALKNTIGMQRLKLLVLKRYPRSTWYSLKSQFESYNYESIPNSEINYINTQLDAYKPFLLNNFSDLTLNS